MDPKQTDQSEDYLHQPHSKAKYSKTSMKKKQQLIDLVINHQYSIYKASKKLKLSNSTAKSILRNYEKYGTILQKFTKNRILKLITVGQQKQSQKKNIMNSMVKRQQVQNVQYQQQKLQNKNIQEQYYPFMTYPYVYYSNMGLYGCP